MKEEKLEEKTINLSITALHEMDTRVRREQGTAENRRFFSDLNDTIDNLKRIRKQEYNY